MQEAAGENASSCSTSRDRQEFETFHSSRTERTLMTQKSTVEEHAVCDAAPKQLVMPLILALAMWIAPENSAAQNAERSGKEVVDAVCIACHGTGANGAPKIGDKKAWSKLASRGLTGLSENALKGVRKMPPHGGNPTLSDTEVERAITYMVNQSGGHWTEPVSTTAPAAERSGEQVVKAQCVKCHETGVGGAPKIGRASCRERV